MIFEHSEYEWVPPARKFWFWPLIAVKGLWIAIITLTLAPILYLIRISQGLFGLKGCEYWVFRLWGRLSWLSFSVKPVIHGTPMKGGGAVVSNHANWLDIPILSGAIGAYMVSKAEVSGWPAIGLLSRTVGTVFVDRQRASSKEQTETLLARLRKGDRIAFFPEGTSTDGIQIVKFRSTLFAAMVEADPEAYVQPVSIVYHAPKGASVNFFGWWAGMALSMHLFAVMGLFRRQKVDVVFHEPIKIGTNRKALCSACQEAVEAGFREFADKI